MNPGSLFAGTVTAVAPLLVRPEGGTTGIAIESVYSGVGQVEVGDRVQLAWVSGRLHVAGRVRTDPVPAGRHREGTETGGVVVADFRLASSHFHDITGDTEWRFVWPTLDTSEFMVGWLEMRVDGSYTHTWPNVAFWPDGTEPAFDLVDGVTHRWTVQLVRAHTLSSWQTRVVLATDYA